MEFLAHRGLWSLGAKKNSLEAFHLAFEYGVGIETDIRDMNSRIVISHDMPCGDMLTLDELFSLYVKLQAKTIMALNVKADGIQTEAQKLLTKYDIQNYFLFDMSVPEFVVNNKLNLISFTRQSDIERECILYSKATGVWVDSFFDDRWLKKDTILEHLANGKKVALVSPELHQHDYKILWSFLYKNSLHKEKDLFLCTDLPQEAVNYFNGKD